MDITTNHNLNQITDKTTRNDRILDLIFVNNPTCINKISTLPPIGLADHDIVYVEVDIWLKRIRETPRKVLKFNKVNWENVRSDLINTLDKIITNYTVSDVDSLLKYIDINVPQNVDI